MKNGIVNKLYNSGIRSRVVLQAGEGRKFERWYSESPVISMLNAYFRAERPRHLSWISGNF